MKNILKLIFTLFLFFTTLYAENINECKTDIYYGNGVWNEPEDAEQSRVRLQKLINKEIINGDQKLQAKYGEVKLQYNWGQGTMLDVLETYYQLKAAGQVNNYQFFALMEILTKGNSALAIGAVATQTLMEPFTRGWEQGNVDEMWMKYYNESFKFSHKVLLVSHSQGGLFANRVYDKIAPTGYKSYFANLQVASPASQVKATKGDHVTLSTDLGSVDPVVNFIPGSMSPNVSGESGHAFVSAYLSQADPLAKITTKMKQLLASLDTEPSQWVTESEQNKGTKEYRITVKHRFDTSIGNIANVYPFAPSKKLYYVQGAVSEDISGYVKASCGGTKILDADIDTWANQKADEVYYLDGTGEVIVVKPTPIVRLISNVSRYFVTFKADEYPTYDYVYSMFLILYKDAFDFVRSDGFDSSNILTFTYRWGVEHVIHPGDDYHDSGDIMGSYFSLDIRSDLILDGSFFRPYAYYHDFPYYGDINLHIPIYEQMIQKFNAVNNTSYTLKID